MTFLLNAQKSIADVIKQIKGSASHWVNEQNLIPEKFAWQTGYGAYSVSESQLEKVFQYIKNQIISEIIQVIISNLLYHSHYFIFRDNISIILCDFLLHITSNILNEI